MKEQNINKKTNAILIIEDIIFYTILIPLIIIATVILFQKIVQPDKIPDIFGYKMFIVLDGKMDSSIEYGDLVFTRNIDSDNLKINNVVAFRNKTNKVTIHRIIDVEKENKNTKLTMMTAQNEVGDTKFIKAEQVEGIIINRIPKIGLIILFIQYPAVMAFLSCIILIIGLIIYYIAQELDKRDALILESQEHTECITNEQQKIDCIK